jgi:hypothetical protein
MKQKDILLIVVIAIVSGVISLFVSKLIFVTPANRQQNVETVPAISTTFTQPSTKYFNSQSVDPTQLIQIGDSSNSTPFNGTSQ